MNQIKIGLLIASGFEEIEAITPYDIFKRAGVEVELISVSDDLAVVSDRKLKIECDQLLKNVKWSSLTALYIPGGKGGVETLSKLQELKGILRNLHELKVPIFAICAAPVLLARLGLFKAEPLTGHPSIKEELQERGYKYVENTIAKSENLWTSQGAGTSAHFCFEIISKFYGQEVSTEIKQAMVFK
jgi:4-methyl-5(b-hydroxyethyl)-thiazole monophosphate biosynthesis